jgi:hypothetical protein
MNEETILRKIQKAMALANDQRGDANTAAIALRQAQAMMEKYGISDEKMIASSCTHDDMRSRVSVVNPSQWEVNIVWTVCKAFGCKPLWSKGGPEPTMKGWWSIVGPKNYVPVAMYTLTVTIRELLKARTAFVKDFGPRFKTRGEKSKAADEFCLGWGYAVRREIHKMADPDGLIEKATDAYAKRWQEPEDKPKVKNRADGKVTAAMKLGGALGSEFKIHRPMNTGPETLKIEK